MPGVNRATRDADTERVEEHIVLKFRPCEVVAAAAVRCLGDEESHRSASLAAAKRRVAVA